MTDVVPLNRCGYAGFHCEALVVLLFPAKGKLGWQEAVLQCMVERVSWEPASPSKGECSGFYVCGCLPSWPGGFLIGT